MLSPWQKKQAALLYRFASLEYLKSVKVDVDKLLKFSAVILDAAALEKRDATLLNSRWGDRNTSQNWGNNAWDALADFQLALAKDIANRAIEVFDVTGRNHCARALAEFSMEWTTEDEQATFDSMFSALSKRALNIDQTMNKYGTVSKWNDYSLTLAWDGNADEIEMLPLFRVRHDVSAETGSIPMRTGVYFCPDDPNASLQFAWAGSGGHLLESSTFNSLGESALATVGRSNLWRNGPRMLEFLSANTTNADLQSDPFFDDSYTEDLAASLVARHAFTSAAGKWYFVEQVHGEFEPYPSENEKDGFHGNTTLRFEAGAKCPVEGFYFTPAVENSRRHFATGEIFPSHESAYGTTIWQYDGAQTKF